MIEKKYLEMKGIYILLSLLILASTSLEAKKKKYPNGDYYEGEWKKNQPNGLGKMIYANGETYEGEWLNGLFHGKGKMTYQNGNIYEGSWENGLSNGTGKMIYFNGNEYDGLWKNGKIIKGKGKIVGLNGSIYEGEWNEEWNNINSQNEDVFNGTNLSNNNSLTLQGTYLNSMGGLFWGKCIMQTTNTSFVTFNGLLPNNWNNWDVDRTTLRYSRTTPYDMYAKYDGDISNFKRDGKGKIEFTQYKMKIEGTWEDDFLVEGNGTCIYENCDYSFSIKKDGDIYLMNASDGLSNIVSKAYNITFTKQLDSVPTQLVLAGIHKVKEKERLKKVKQEKIRQERLRQQQLKEAEELKIQVKFYNANLINKGFVCQAPCEEYMPGVNMFLDISGLKILAAIIFENGHTLKYICSATIDKDKVQINDFNQSRGYLMQQYRYAKSISKNEQYEYKIKDGYLLFGTHKYKLGNGNTTLYDVTDNVYFYMKPAKEILEIEEIQKLLNK